jgi:hypothetical protein
VVTVWDQNFATGLALIQTFDRIFWNLSCSESESSWSKLGLDKRKTKTIGKHSRTHQKRVKIPKLIRPSFAQICHHRSRILL